MSQRPLDLDLLRTFVAVVEAGNLTSAAPKVGRSQSAVSMQIQRLEEELGRTLLLRRARSTVPTAAGDELLTYARQLLRLSDEARASISRPEETGTVRFGIPDDYAAFLLPKVLAGFAESHPLVHVELVCEPSRLLVPAVERGEIDVAVVTRQRSQPFDVIRYEPLVWVASARHDVWLRDPLPVALFEPDCAARLQVVEALTGAGRNWRSTYSSASLLGLCAAVQTGLAVAGLAAASVPPEFRVIGAAEGLPPLPPLEMSLLRAKSASGTAADRLVAFLEKELKA